MHSDETSASHPLALTRIDALPLLLAIGILGYGVMEEEPSWWIAAAIPVWSSLVLLHRHQPPMRDGALAVVIMVLGMMAALWQTERVDSPRIPERYKPWVVTGRVITASPDEGKAKLLVAVEKIEDLAKEEQPRRIRVSVRGKKALPEAGERISFRAILYAPSPPLMPGGFDFARYFYYRGIGAVGYALPPVTRLDEPGKTGVFEHFSRLRFAVQEWLLANIPQPAGGVAMALVTGDRTALDEKTAEAFRVSSLAHILSISGMHMSIVCGLLFVLLRSLLSLAPPVAMHRNVKKISAVIALLFGAAYLALADFPVPAVRAYVMVAFFFAGVLLDREALTVRSLVWAAVVILLVQPSSLQEPGFQLSFAATLALIVAYRRFAASDLGNRWEERRWWKRVGIYFSGIILSSLVASAATAPFIAYHFNQFSPYGVLANLLALPLLSFIVMPALLLSLALWPLGLESGAIQVAGWGLARMVDVAQGVESIPGASWYIPPVAPPMFVMVVTGMLLYMVAPRRFLRRAGVAMVVLGIATAWTYTPPDMLVSDDGKQLAINLSSARSGKPTARGEGQWVLVRGKSNRNFVVEQWQQGLGVEMATYKEWSNAHPDAQALTCTQEACIWRGEGKSFTFPMRGKILVSWEEGAITWPDLDRKGAHALWWRGEAQPRVVTGCDAQSSRPWTACGESRYVKAGR